MAVNRCAPAKDAFFIPQPTFQFIKKVFHFVYTKKELKQILFTQAQVQHHWCKSKYTNMNVEDMYVFVDELFDKLFRHLGIRKRTKVIIQGSLPLPCLLEDFWDGKCFLSCQNLVDLLSQDCTKQLKHILTEPMKKVCIDWKVGDLEEKKSRYL